MSDRDSKPTDQERAAAERGQATGRRDDAPKGRRSAPQDEA